MPSKKSNHAAPFNYFEEFYSAMDCMYDVLLLPLHENVDIEKVRYSVGDSMEHFDDVHRAIKKIKKQHVRMKAEIGRLRKLVQDNGRAQQPFKQPMVEGLPK